jgi:hypothetical protein
MLGYPNLNKSKDKQSIATNLNEMPVFQVQQGAIVILRVPNPAVYELLHGHLKPLLVRELSRGTVRNLHNQHHWLRAFKRFTVQSQGTANREEYIPGREGKGSCGRRILGWDGRSRRGPGASSPRGIATRWWASWGQLGGWAPWSGRRTQRRSGTARPPAPPVLPPSRGLPSSQAGRCRERRAIEGASFVLFPSSHLARSAPPRSRRASRDGQFWTWTLVEAQLEKTMPQQLGWVDSMWAAENICRTLHHRTQ